MRLIQGIVFCCCIFSTLSASKEESREKLLGLFAGEWVSRGLYVATKLEIAEHLAQGPKSVEELAFSTKSDPESLCRLLRMLSGFGVFEETSERMFSNTQISSLLEKSRPDTLHDLSLFYGEDIHKSWEGLLPAVETGRTAFQTVFKQPVFGYFKENPVRAALFQRAMKEKSEAVIESALTVYDFSKATSVYDIGGGHGRFLQAIFAGTPKLQGTLFDLPEVIGKLDKQSFEEKNCKLVAGDFFTSIPEGGDIYLLKSVLHDWDDEQCKKILRNCKDAMGDTSRLLIVEIVLRPKECPYANCVDMLMLAVTGGKERSLSSFTNLLEETGFTLEKIYPTSTEFSILEVRKK